MTSGNIIVRNMIFTDKEPFLALYKKMRQKFKNSRRYVFLNAPLKRIKKKSAKSIENSWRTRKNNDIFLGKKTIGIIEHKFRIPGPKLDPLEPLIISFGGL